MSGSKNSSSPNQDIVVGSSSRPKTIGNIFLPHKSKISKRKLKFVPSRYEAKEASLMTMFQFYEPRKQRWGGGCWIKFISPGWWWWSIFSTPSRVSADASDLDDGYYLLITVKTRILLFTNPKVQLLHLMNLGRIVFTLVWRQPFSKSEMLAKKNMKWNEPWELIN